MSRALTPRQRKAIKARLEGKSERKTAVIAGYSSGPAVHRMIANGSASEAMQAALKRKGIDDDAIAATVERVLGAEKAVPPNSIMVPDYRTQAVGADIALKIGGGYAPTKAELSGPNGKPLVLAKPMSIHDLAAAAVEVSKATARK